MRELRFITIVFTILSFVPTIANSQESFLKLEKIHSNKRKIIKENSRVKIKLENRHTIKGWFKIINDSTLLIKDITIPLNHVLQMKKEGTILRIIGGSIIGVGISIISLELLAPILTVKRFVLLVLVFLG